MSEPIRKREGWHPPMAQSILRLMREHGQQTDKICACCQIYKLWNLGEFHACPRCDTSIEDRDDMLRKAGRL